jgi:hypothetical protein
MSYGISTILNPLLIFLVDVSAHNYNCGDVNDICRLDYTSSDCNCFVGDFMKLYIRFIRDESSGMSGIIITLAIYTISSSFAALILYEYMVYVHKNAR